MPLSTRTSGFRRWAAALAVAALLAACGEAAPVGQGADAGSEPAAAADGASSDAATPAAASSDAATVGDAVGALSVAGLEGATLHGITTGADGALVAVGAVGSTAAAWSQAAGDGWQRADVEDADQVDRLRAVSSGAGGFVAFGGADDQPSIGWTSDDGAVWTPFEAEGVAVRVNAVAADGDGWVAVGDRIAREGGGTAAGVVLSSADGVTWEVATDRLRAGDGTVSDVAVGGATVVAVGFDTAGGRIWHDPESRRRPVEGDFAGTTIQGVAATGDGFVALGQAVGDLRPVAWTSPDGARWERYDVDAGAFEPTDELMDLAATDDGLVAAGASPDGGVLWTSADGLAWTRVEG